jgi:hypothetical protein
MHGRRDVPSACPRSRLFSHTSFGLSRRAWRAPSRVNEKTCGCKLHLTKFLFCSSLKMDNHPASIDGGVRRDSREPEISEIAMTWTPLPNRARCLQVTLAVLVYLTSASVAHATMTCTWFDELSSVLDPSSKEPLEAHVRTLPGLKNYEIRFLQDHYFLVQAEGKFCKDIPRCEHRLLELRDGVVRNVFAFEGTGMVWRLWSPLRFLVENLEDYYAAWAFKTTESTYIRVDLPSLHDMVVIGSPGPVEMQTLRACDGIKK